MIMNPAAMLAEFHAALGQPFGHGDLADRALRIKLQREETEELADALEARNLTWAAQELADVVYVAYGTAHVLGIPLDAVLAEVHRANMSKFGDDGQPLLREDGKLLKSDRYVPPDVAATIREHVCEHCEGSGVVEATDENGDLDNAACTDCDGTGRPA